MFANDGSLHGYCIAACVHMNNDIGCALINYKCDDISEISNRNKKWTLWHMSTVHFQVWPKFTKKMKSDFTQYLTQLPYLTVFNLSHIFDLSSSI